MKPSTNSTNGTASNKSLGANSSTSKAHSKKTPNKSSTNWSKSKKTTSSAPGTTAASSSGGHVVAASAGHVSSAAQIAATPESAGTAATGSTSGANKDKSQYKSYAGFHANSIKVFWEQFSSHDIEVHPEVQSRLAEDATYKVWELCNNLKTYSRHSGGVVTVDGLNEVLKDSDVPPVIGASTAQTQWDHDVDSYGTYYFSSDETLELRDEYLKEVNVMQCGALRLASGWKLDKKASVDLSKFSKDLCVAIMSGDEETFDYASHIALISSNVACVLRSVLRFCLKILMFEYTAETLERVLQLLIAIVRNPHTRDCTMQDDQLYHLSQLMMCLVLGPLDMNVGMADYQRELLELKQREYEIDSIAKELQLSVKQEPTSVAPSSMYPAMDVDEIKNECEALLQMMENEGFEATTQDGSVLKGIKTSVIANPTIITNPKEVIIKQEVLSDRSPLDTSAIKDEPATYYEDEFVFHPNTDTSSSYAKTPKLPDDDENSEHTPGESPNVDAANAEVPNTEPEPELFSTLSTTKCSDDVLDQVLAVIGSLASKWGYFESELVYLVSKRMDKFFLNVTETTVLDFDWIVRALRLLWTLGDYAFREMTVHFEKIDTLQTPEWIQYYFNSTAIFLRGRDDIFLYEYLYDLCGDGLTPFMVYYSKYSERHALRLKRRRTKANAAALCIPPQLLLRSFELPGKQFRPQMDAIFPKFVRANHSPHIGFAFAGCKPVNRIKSNVDTSPAHPSVDTPIFNSKVVVCRRRLMKKLIRGKNDLAVSYELRRLCL